MNENEKEMINLFRRLDDRDKKIAQQFMQELKGERIQPKPAKIIHFPEV